jgi:hypothetical protein
VQGLGRVSKFIDSLHAAAQGTGQPGITQEDAQRLLATWGAAFTGWQGQVGSSDDLKLAMFAAVTTAAISCFQSLSSLGTEGQGLL